MEDDSENYHESHEEDEEFELEDESGLSQVHQEADADNADENDGDGSEEDDDVEESKHIEKPVETILQLHHLPERSTNLELTVANEGTCRLMSSQIRNTFNLNVQENSSCDSLILKITHIHLNNCLILEKMTYLIPVEFKLAESEAWQSLNLGQKVRMTPTVQEVFIKVATSEFVLGRKPAEAPAMVTPHKIDKGVESEEEYLLTASKPAPPKVEEEKSEPEASGDDENDGEEGEDEFAGFIVEEEVDEDDGTDDADENNDDEHDHDEVGSDGEIIMRSSKKLKRKEKKTEIEEETPEKPQDSENVMQNDEQEGANIKQRPKRGLGKQQQQGNSGKKARQRASKKTTTQPEENKEQENNNPQDCTICLGEVGRLPTCRHVFCFMCIQGWSQVTNLCPLCKKEFKKIQQFNDLTAALMKTLKVRAKKQKVKQEEEVVYDVDENCDDACYKCKTSRDENKLLVCEKCNWFCCHIYCLEPPLEEIPDTAWYCSYCASGSSEGTDRRKDKIIQKRREIREQEERERKRSRSRDGERRRLKRLSDQTVQEESSSPVQAPAELAEAAPKVRRKFIVDEENENDCGNVDRPGKVSTMKGTVENVKSRSVTPMRLPPAQVQPPAEVGTFTAGKASCQPLPPVIPADMR